MSEKSHVIVGRFSTPQKLHFRKDRRRELTRVDGTETRGK